MDFYYPLSNGPRKGYILASVYMDKGNLDSPRVMMDAAKELGVFRE